MREIKRKYISIRKFPQSTQSTKGSWHLRRDAGFNGLADFADPRAEGRVGRRAVRELGLIVGDHGALVIREMHAVREDSPRGEQFEVVIHGGVIICFWIEIVHEFQLIQVLRQMRLDM